MNAAPMVTDLPAGPGWCFGGYLYGLEPLTLPSPGMAGSGLTCRAPGAGAADGYADACRRILAPGKTGGGELTEEVYWFRWITGHQVSFVIWWLMAQTLNELRSGLIDEDAAAQTLCRCVHGYTAMLLYTSSCPQRVYRELIRPSMYRQHRGFSGAWAPDYRPVRHVFQGRALTGTGGQMPGELRQAVSFCQTVHEGVGARLVPGGRSLLQAAAAARRAHDTQPGIRLLGALFDSYFMTLRGAVSAPDIVAQMLRRLVALAHDITTNGLYPPDDAPDRPLELRAPGVADFEGKLTAICAEVARSAIALVSSDQAAGTTA